MKHLLTLSLIFTLSGCAGAIRVAEVGPVQLEDGLCVVPKTECVSGVCGTLTLTLIHVEADETGGPDCWFQHVEASSNVFDLSALPTGAALGWATAQSSDALACDTWAAEQARAGE